VSDPFEPDLDSRSWPTLSVVMPIRNEAAHLERAIESVLGQEYPLPFDVCLAIAPSDDGTEELAARLAADEPRLKVVPNRVGTTPAGLNAAIAATDGDVIVRVDGHAALSPGYIARAVETMIRTGAVNVGGRQVPQPETSFENAVAAATTSWFGTGGATYRVGGQEGPVDTVYLGVFDRSAGDRVGWFAEDLIRNQDYELNIRLRAAGGIVWFDPVLWAGYRPRGTWAELARQYHEYGFWKARVLALHTGSVRLRQVAPLGATVGIACSLVGAARWRPLLLVPAAYIALLAASCRGRVRQTAVLATMHLAWGTGFLRSVGHRRPCD
jgi:glycosyltransferase involved in cell wall biosynthesis